MYAFEFTLLLIIMCLLGIWITFKRTYKKWKLSKNQKRLFHSKINQISLSKKSSREKIIDYDILIHKVFIALWYEWSLGTILKSQPKEIKEIDELWRLHKTRNTLVHEESQHSEKSLKVLVNQYEKYIVSLLKSL